MRSITASKARTIIALEETEGADFISFLLSFKRVKIQLFEGFSSLLLFDWGIEIG
jgi:hypothetical protein